MSHGTLLAGLVLIAGCAHCCGEDEIVLPEVTSDSQCASPAVARACNHDSDCACGTNKGTGHCDFGRLACIDPEQRCPDFCTGLAANLAVVCRDHVCQQVSRQ